MKTTVLQPFETNKGYKGSMARRCTRRAPVGSVLQQSDEAGESWISASHACSIVFDPVVCVLFATNSLMFLSLALLSTRYIYIHLIKRQTLRVHVGFRNSVCITVDAIAHPSSSPRGRSPATPSCNWKIRCLGSGTAGYCDAIMVAAIRTTAMLQ